MSTNKSNPKRNHHELPRLYHQGFCDGESSFFWIFERRKPYNPGIKKHKNNPCRCGVKEIAEQDRFARVMPDGTKDFESVENRLEKLEKPADDILRKICSQTPITSNEKEIFANYIQNLYKRIKDRETGLRRLLDMTQKSPDWHNIPLSFALNGQFETARKHYDAQRWLESENGKRFLVLESMVTHHPLLHLEAMRWTFYVAAGGSYFVTSNAPMAFDPGGLAISPLLFPISKNVALIARHGDGKDLDFKTTSLDETLMINYYTIVNARKVYSPTSEEWIWKILEEGLAMTVDQSLAFRRLYPFR